jgi:hypothetical protein
VHWEEESLNNTNLSIFQLNRHKRERHDQPVRLRGFVVHG